MRLSFLKYSRIITEPGLAGNTSCCGSQYFQGNSSCYCNCAIAQDCIAVSTGFSDAPFSVSEYSTVGGTVA